MSPDGPIRIGCESLPDSFARWGTPGNPVPDLVIPQYATLDGTVLHVGSRQCDLATASAVRIRTALSPMDFLSNINCKARLLEVQPGQARPPISLVISLHGKSLLRTEHLRLLAAIIAERTWGPGPGRAGKNTSKDARRAAGFLTWLADLIDRDGQPIDWSFRAGPMSDRRRSPGNYA